MRVLAIESSCDESAAAVLDAARGLLAHELYSQVRAAPRPTAAWCRSWPRAITCAGCCRWCAGARSGPPRHRTARRRRLHRRPGADRRAADGRGARAQPRLRLGRAGDRRTSPGRAPAGAAPRAGAAAFPARRAAGLRGTHPADRGRARSARTACSATTRDDAAGEAFDKTAKLLGLPYPGGPQLARSPQQRPPRAPSAFRGPMLDRPGLEFSFSGLKTAVLHAVRGRELTDAAARGRRARGAGGDRRDAHRQGAAGARGHRPRRAGGLGRRRRQPRAACAPHRGRRQRAARACTIRASSSAPTTRR